LFRFKPSLKTRLSDNYLEKLREWQAKGITRLTLSIDKPESMATINAVGGEQMRIQVNKIVKDHIDNIINYCENNLEHTQQLMDKEWCHDQLGITFPLIILANDAKKDEELHKRYWVQEHLINGQNFRFCSQFGGNNAIGTKTMSEYHGEKFTLYLKSINLLLPEYNYEKVQFVVKH